MKKIIPVTLFITTLLSCNKKDQQANSYRVDDTVSKAAWNGAAPDHFHIGSFKVTGALTATPNGNVKGGDFVIPIASIEDYDLTDTAVRKMLLDDLKSANFFNMVVHPDASFHITNVTAYSGGDTAAITGANYMITGNFTMIGKTNSISFPAKITTSTTGITTEANFNVDRTKWGINIYSDPTQQLYILPNVKIHLTVYAAKEGK